MEESILTESSSVLYVNDKISILDFPLQIIQLQRVLVHLSLYYYLKTPPIRVYISYYKKFNILCKLLSKVFIISKIYIQVILSIYQI